MLFTTIATSITSNTFFTKKDNSLYRINNTISLPSSWISIEKSSPYFLIVSALLDSNKKIFLNDAFAMPVYSTSLLMPLESNYERTILKILIKFTKDNKDLIIEKPLICLQDENKNKYRPDFIITNLKKDKNIYIEVLGSTNEEYILHKDHLSMIAKKYCSYFLSVKAYDIRNEYSVFTYQLQQALNKLS